VLASSTQYIIGQHHYQTAGFTMVPSVSLMLAPTTLLLLLPAQDLVVHTSALTRAEHVVTNAHSFDEFDHLFIPTSSDTADPLAT
jgi:hypothetical protein